MLNTFLLNIVKKYGILYIVIDIEIILLLLTWISIVDDSGIGILGNKYLEGRIVMSKMLKSFYLQPLFVVFQLAMLFGMFMSGYMVFFSDYLNKNSIGSTLFYIFLFPYALYLTVFRPAIKLNRFLNNLPLYEKKQFISDLRYDPVMGVWRSGRYLIANMLIVADSDKIVWMHGVKNTFSFFIIPIFKKNELAIYLNDNTMKPPYGKPTFPLQLPKKCNPEIIAQYLLFHNPNILLGYTKENVDVINHRYGTKYVYSRGKTYNFPFPV